MSKVDARKKPGEDSGGGKLLNDIETINRNLYLDKTRSRSLMSSTASSRSKSVGKPVLPEPKSKVKEDNKDSMEKDKKSIWKWKGFKALTHALDRRFNCYFSLHVHSIEGLPPLFDDLSLVVHWKRRDGELATRPAMVCQGVAEFEERLVHSCSVYGRSGTNHAAKYEAKHFLLYAAVYGTPEVDLGKHRIDLTRLLPLTLEELEEEKSSGKWTTSYRLSGEAKGGVLNVSFGYEVVGNNKMEASAEKGISGLHNFRQNSECRVLRQTDQSNEQGTIRRTGSLPAISSISNQSAEDIKDLHEVLPVSKSELSDSISMLYQKLDELKLDTPVEIAKPEIYLLLQPDETIKPDIHLSTDAGKENDDDGKKNYDDECNIASELSEFTSNRQETPVEDIKTADHDSTESLDSSGAVDVAPEAEKEIKHLSSVEFLDGDFDSKEADISSKESLMGEMESALASVSDLGKEGLDTEDRRVLSNSENHVEIAPNHIPRKGKSLDLDETEEEIKHLSSVEFLDGGFDSKEADISSKESLMEELESALASVSDLGKEGLDTEDGRVLSNSENHVELTPNDMLRKGKSLDLDEAEEEIKHLTSVEFLDGGVESIEADISSKESLMEELELALTSVSDLGKEGLDTEYGGVLSNSEKHLELTPNYMPRKGKSFELDDVTETIASEFLGLLGMEYTPFGWSSESDPESPRERLLRQFEKDTLARGFSFFSLNEEDQPEFVCDARMESDGGMFSQDCDPSSFEHASEEFFHIQAEAISQKTKASIMEDMETEALMREWGLNEKAFQSSPPSTSGGFGSPIDMPPQIPDHLPSIGQGLGPFVQTKNGEFLCSMNPALFRNPKNRGSLIMQVSSPVVMPAELGSGVMDILQNLASIGIEKLSMQANKLMPLENINGKTIQQIAWEAAPTLDGPERDTALLPHESGYGQGTSGKIRRTKAKTSASGYDKFQQNSIGSDRDSDYVSLEDLAPLAINKIEALAIEGLKIQSGMSDDVAPENINMQSIGEFSALEGKRASASGSTGLEGSGGLQLLDIKDNGDDVDGLMALSLSLDEWMRLDSGEIYDEDGISERTSKLLAAHHAKSTDLFQARLKDEKRRSKGCNFGLLGNNFNVALMVQLRDPLRDYETVGAPMLALIQVERVFIPPKPKIYSSVSELREADEEDDDTEPAKKDIEKPIEKILPEEEQIPQFKITEVHVAGLKTEPGKSKLWGSGSQQQSGSRWLLANGMGKKNKHPLMKSKAGPKSSLPGSTAVKPGDAFWSVSSGSHRAGVKQKEMNKLNSHVRNPDVPLRNETFRLQQRSGFIGFI